jgi:hypothetical protein
MYPEFLGEVLDFLSLEARSLLFTHRLNWLLAIKRTRLFVKKVELGMRRQPMKHADWARSGMVFE